MKDDIFFVLDFDRTLCDTSLVTQRFEGFLGSAYPKLAIQLRAAREHIERTGGSFDVMTVLGDVRDISIEGILSRFVEEEANENAYLLPSAHLLLRTITEAGSRWGIMTYGGEAWQRTKLRLLGFNDTSAIILSKKGKGVQIALWKGVEGYNLPAIFGGGLARRVVLIDDKAVEFVGLPEESQGYLLRSSTDDALLLSQQGDVAPNVTIVHDLGKVIAHEQL